MVLWLFRSVGNGLVVLQIERDCANPFSNMYLSPLSSFSSLGALVGFLACFGYHTAVNKAVRLRVPVRSIASVQINRPCSSHLQYSTPNALWESILGIKLHLSSTIKLDGLLVQASAMALRSAESALRSSCTLDSAQLNVDLDTTLSSVNVGQTLKSLLLTFTNKVVLDS